MTEQTPIDDLTYEQAFGELQTTIAELEGGDKPLEETLTLYERGQALYKRCTDLLDKADIKIQQLTEDGNLEEI
ncbi:MAG TPA: exodeoxyribonuclease VII small subunit [Anaerolineales bacterium]|nr:exodeoxyribonuclease VII small subunit [Anaerolineales bacterium]